MFKRDNPIIGIYVGLIGPAIGILAVLLSIHFAPWFSWDIFALSDLGIGQLVDRDIRTAPSNNLHIFIFNFGMIISGILIAAFIILTRSLQLDTVISKIGYSLMFIGAICLALVGVFPLPMAIHFIVAAIYFIVTPIGLAIVGCSYLSESRIFGVALILIGAVAFLSIIEIVAPYLFDIYTKGIAIPEMVEATLLSLGLWLIAFRFWSEKSNK
tara:strand:+ start:282 stop:920 length:639 start_codon:yes stop_codon:yes gene_type:complete